MHILGGAIGIVIVCFIGGDDSTFLDLDAFPSATKVHLPEYPPSSSATLSSFSNAVVWSTRPSIGLNKPLSRPAWTPAWTIFSIGSRFLEHASYVFEPGPDLIIDCQLPRFTRTSLTANCRVLRAHHPWRRHPRQLSPSG